MSAGAKIAIGVVGMGIAAGTAAYMLYKGCKKKRTGKYEVERQELVDKLIPKSQKTGKNKSLKKMIFLKDINK